MSIQSLVKFWAEPVMPDANGRYIHPDDREVLEGWLTAARPHKPRSVNTLAIPQEGKEPPRTGQLHLSLPPMPYVGNLASAKIVLGMINPTVGRLDYSDNQCLGFKELRERTLNQEEARCFALDRTSLAKAGSWSAYYLMRYSKGL